MSVYAVPSPSKPVLQVHVKLPTVLAHAASVSQSSALVEQQTACSRQTTVGSPARRSATSRSPRQPFRRLIRTDRERPATLRRP